MLQVIKIIDFNNLQPKSILITLISGYYIPTLQATIIVPRCGTIIVASFIAMLKATIFVPRIRGTKIVASCAWRALSGKTSWSSLVHVSL